MQLSSNSNWIPRLLYSLFGSNTTRPVLPLPSDPSVVRWHGAVNAGAEESGGLHPAPEGSGHECRPEGRRRDGCDAGPRGGLLHQVRGLQLCQDGTQVRRPVKLFPSAFCFEYNTANLLIYWLIIKVLKRDSTVLWAALKKWCKNVQNLCSKLKFLVHGRRWLNCLFLDKGVWLCTDPSWFSTSLPPFLPPLFMFSHQYFEDGVSPLGNAAFMTSIQSRVLFR